MFRLLVVPVSLGILTFLFIYFLSPAIIPKPGIVSFFAEFVLYLSNACFDNMPQAITNYISNLNLLKVAVTAGLILTVVFQLLVIVGIVFIGAAKWIISILQREKGEAPVADLPPIEMDSKYKRTVPGAKIVGRGLDSDER